MSNKVVNGFCLSLLLSVYALSVFGQVDTTLTRKQLKEVVVKKRQSGNLLKSATPRQNVSHDEMEQIGAINVSEAIKHMAGVTLRDYGGAGGMKTVSIRGLGAQFTAVNYDGVAVSDIQNGQIDLQRYTLSGIGNVSLQIGDGTDIFSSARNATLPSLIEINTSLPTDQNLHLLAQTTIGAWGYTAPSVKFDKSFGKLSLSLVADYVYAENDYPFTVYNVSERIHKRRVHSLMNQGHGEATLGYRFNDSHYLSLKAYYYDNDRQLPGIVRYYTSESEQNLRERNAFSQLQYRGRLSRKVSLKSAAKWNWASSDYKDLLYTNRIMDARYFQREGYLTNALLWSPLRDISLSAASDYIYNSLNSRSKTSVNQRPVRNTFLNTVSARWNRDNLSASVRLLHSVYLNDTHIGESGRNYRRFTPSAALSFKPTREINVRMSWKKIFRMSSFSDLYYYHLGTKELKPEQTTQYNVGVTLNHRISPRLEVEATVDGYLNKVRDKIVSIPVNLFVWQNINAAKVTVKGLDFTAAMRYAVNRHHSVKFRGHYSFQQAVDRSSVGSASYDKQIAYMPRHTFSFVATWENPWVGISIDADGQSRRWATNSHAVDTDISGYAEFGATLFRKFSLGNRQTLNVSFSLTNIFNKQYEVVAHYPMPGRGWRTSLSYSF